MQRSYQIFGKDIKINTMDSIEGKILHDELVLYPVSNKDHYDVLINYVSEIEMDKALSVNPSLNCLHSDSMVFKMGAATARFYFKDYHLRKIDFSIDGNTKIRNTVQKWKSIQYASNYEAIGQLFHELILVPMAFLFDDCSIVHSSGVINNKDKAVLFGGTGGVGKTSLEMTLCLDHECSFFNDDIAVINSNGSCYPNFSYPKIYGYNLEGNPNLKKKIMSQLSPFDKIHYALHSLKGKNKVRRRVQPETFYGKVANTPKKVSSFVILFRNKIDKITLESISAQKASALNSIIISSEYNIFFNHLKWHSFNSYSLNREPFTTYQSIIEKNKDNLEKSIRGLDQVYIAHIPLKISNNDYKTQMVNILKEYKII
tara:strand:- start:41081 stop:42196 length:1116 start_codon:yes stop_codon:yes gene_type:complete